MRCIRVIRPGPVRSPNPPWDISKHLRTIFGPWLSTSGSNAQATSPRAASKIKCITYVWFGQAQSRHWDPFWDISKHLRTTCWPMVSARCVVDFGHLRVHLSLRPPAANVDPGNYPKPLGNAPRVLPPRPDDSTSKKQSAWSMVHFGAHSVHLSATPRGVKCDPGNHP